MPRNHIKNTKHANVFKAAREEKAAASESISKKPTWNHLLKFALPTILSMLIMSTFGIVDGIFVSRLIDPIALSVVSLVFPFMSFVMAFGFMMGVGGNALVAKKIGEGREKEGRENFSLITLVSFVVSLALTLIGILFPDFILGILGVDAFAREMSLAYLQPMLWFLPTAVLGMIFQQFLITAGKAHYSAIMSLVGGLTSAGLNYVFIYILDMGLSGAALATSIGFTLPFVVGFIYFIFNRNGKVYLVCPKWDFKALGRASVNGASEMVTMLATSIVAVLMNNILMDLEGGGHMAVAAAAIMFGGMGIFSALFVGYSSGVAPIISYNYGKGDTSNLKKTYSNSLRLIGILSAASIVMAILSADLLISIYDIPAGTPMHDMARTGLMFLASGFIFMGFNSFASMFFTALNNGVVSSILSLFRTLIFISIAFLTLPAIFGLNGAWAAIPVAEVLGIVMTILFFKLMKKKYKYA
ncbi:MAG: MATE family efflux transporter [Defluviitaleaceae bacterium]|nr:MATE family efflux transporter [Defluviitaleaceae bacterium]